MRSVPLPDAPERAGSLFDRVVKERLETPLPVSLPVYTYQELKALTPANYAGVLVRCSNGHAGFECLAYCNGRAWKVIELGASISL